MTHPAEELAEVIRLRHALEDLLETIRWRVNAGGFRPEEREAFEKADRVAKGEE